MGMKQADHLKGGERFSKVWFHSKASESDFTEYLPRDADLIVLSSLQILSFYSVVRRPRFQIS